MTFTDGHFYYQDDKKIMRIPYQPGDRSPREPKEQMANVTFYYSNLHWPKAIDVADDGTIYFGSDDHRVYALRRDGTLRWSADVDGDVRAPLGLGEGVVYAGVFAPRPRVVALDAASGEERWSFAISAGESGGSVSSGPLVDRDGNLYFGADDDFVYSLDPSGGMRWFFRTSGNVDGEPVM